MPPILFTSSFYGIFGAKRQNEMKGYAYIGLVMSVVIVSLGVYTLLDPNPQVSYLVEHPQARQLLGGCMILYGGFRFYRSFRMLKGNEEDL